MQQCKIFFSSFIRHERYFSFILGIFFFARYFLARIFFPRNQSAGHIYTEITHTPFPLKSQMVGPLHEIAWAEFVS